MNAKLLSIALLIVAATGLRAQNAAPAATNTLSYDELQRRAARAKAENRTAAAAETSTAATGADWSATNTPKNVEASAEKTVQVAQVAETKPAAAPAAPSFPNMPNRPATLRPSRPQIPAPAPSVVAEANSTAPAAAAPKMADNTMTIRPPSTASTVKNPDEIIPLPGINWTAADLDQILTIYTEYVGRTVLRPGTLPQIKVALKQVTPLTRLEVVQMIEAAVALNGVSFINVGEKFVTVMPSAEAFKIPGIVNTNAVGDLPVMGSIITHVVQLKYSKPSEMVQVLTPFASGMAANPIMPVDSNGILVLRDNVANVKRMLEMIEKVDTVAQSEIISEVIPIKYAKAEEISSALSSVGGGSGGTVGTRTSSSGGTTGSTLNRAGQPGYNQPGTVPGAATPTPSSGSTFSDRLNNIIRKASASGDLTILGSTKIIADIRSNSLLVFASRQDMEMIKDIIAKLDVVLAQVLIETVIMDVSIDSGWNLGLSGAQFTKSLGNGNNFLGAGVLNNGQPLTTTNLLNTGLGGLTYFASLGPDFIATLNAAANDGRARIVQKPRILTSHAKEGHIFLGESRPIVSSTYYGGGFGGGPSSSYQQQQAGIDLTVTPFVNTEGLVVMEITQEISDFKGVTEITGVGSVPNITQRSIRGEVAVNDGETVLLGGIVLDRKEGSKSGVPILMDIPLVGRLFSNNKETKGRGELVVLMRPTVLKTPELVAKHTILEKEKMPGITEAEIDSEKKEIQDIKRSRAMKSRVKSDEAAPDIFRTPINQSAPAAVPSANFKQKTPFTAEDEAFLLSNQSAPVGQ
jgi:type II secretory pathway component GspD/PulD (secretin)